MASQAMKIRIKSLDEFRNDKRYPSLSEIPYSTMDFDESKIQLACWAGSILHEHMITIKSAFGPLEYDEGMNPESKNAYGQFTIREGLVVKIIVYGAMTCEKEKISEDGPTPQQLEQLIEGAKSGKFTLISCNSMKHATHDQFCKKPGCYTESWGAEFCKAHEAWGKSAKEGEGLPW